MYLFITDSYLVAYLYYAWINWLLIVPVGSTKHDDSAELGEILFDFIECVQGEPTCKQLQL